MRNKRFPLGWKRVLQCASKGHVVFKVSTKSTENRFVTEILGTIRGVWSFVSGTVKLEWYYNNYQQNKSILL